MRRLTIVLVVHRMARQAANAIWSLTTRNQRNVDEDEYKIVVIENESDDLLGEDAARALGKNVWWYLSKARTQTPVFALTRGLMAAATGHVGVVLDGAYIFTPRVVEFALAATKLARNPVVMVPTYHLGEGPQHETSADGYDEEREQELLQKVDWRHDSYRLFETAVPAPGNERGFLVPTEESAALFVRKDVISELKPGYERFRQRGGGRVAAYLLRAACLREGAELIVLAGEGAFHQFHGGTFTSHHEDRAKIHRLATRALSQTEVGDVDLADVEPRLLGVVCGGAHGMVRRSVSVRELQARRDVAPDPESLQTTTSDTMDRELPTRTS